MPRSWRSLIFPRSSASPALMELVLEAFDGEGGIVPTEAKTVAENGVYFALDANVGRVVEIELGIGVLVVDCRRYDAIADDHGADHGFDRARCAQHVAGCRFGGADVDALCGVAKNGLDGAGLVEIVRRRRRAVGIDVLNVLGLQTGVLESALHGALRAFSIGRWCRQVIRVTR